MMGEFDGFNFLLFGDEIILVWERWWMIFMEDGIVLLLVFRLVD
jgi:hypothetical protein